MQFLTEELKKQIEKKVVELMKTSGVILCMKQGSVGFENYIQLGLAGWLQERFPSKTVLVESDSLANVVADIIIKDSNTSRNILAAFELKVIRLGVKNGDGVRMGEILSDIGKLRVLNLANADKGLICAVYLYGKTESSWDFLNSAPLSIDQRKIVLNEIRSNTRPPFSASEINACVDIFEIR
jgi:hypothetical protein